MRDGTSERCDLMEIVENRYGAGSTLINSQLLVEAWHDVNWQLRSHIGGYNRSVGL